MEQLVSGLIVNLFGTAFAALIGAMFVQIATKLAAGFIPSYWSCYLASFLGYIASVFVVFFIAASVGMTGAGLDAPALILLAVIAFFVQAAVYSFVIKNPVKGNITYGQACLLSLFQLLLFGVFLFILFIAIGIGAH